jgi:hypothetical protein
VSVGVSGVKKDRIGNCVDALVRAGVRLLPPDEAST